MALTEQQKQKKAQQKKQKRKSATSENSSQRLQEKLAPYIEYPFYECLIPHNLFAAGIGNMLVSRVSPQGEVAVCSFIIDVYCLGVKQARLKTMPIPEYEKVFKPGIVESHGGYAFTKIKPACAKKLLDGAAQYAKDLGFHSPSSYHALKNIFGEEKLGFCWSRYRYGKDKMPSYIRGPNESTADANKIIATLERSCGLGNFHFHL
ncbi:hypothetical protein [methanotrophic endosymbiont of Bathymodiolus puteoserpentis (Logatchev)]|jgi:hypothetical protein|uniref:hypothetical protein n=1 Tax=methanotrophic endosymbiont of Bathymodiolus puteoserpentis (Logatchev) TaxID=343235 RepID=UPI0013C6BED5|nr:hypothetical protein [methanotrophic endosymbiont of Bathymodiolus puteoserpentis (Logatchev)]SHE20648.1 hypothetical protein BPUTEOMOX_268 [methanotrophic endosymbiont of Bathymodiolus puteoserpentis (Logatchev)]